MSQTTTAQSLGRWLDPPLIIPSGQTVRQVLDSLNDHPFVKDESAQDYVMPTEGYLEEPGRFRIWRENQDNFYCFVDAEQASNTDPPVYFETCLDLMRDCEVTAEDVLPGNVALVATSFQSFLTFMLAHHICLRLEKGRYLADGVNGIVFSKPLEDYSGLANPIGRQFPAGYTAYVGDGVICIPDWGAAFRCEDVRDSFVKCRHPIVGQSWSTRAADRANCNVEGSWPPGYLGRSTAEGVRVDEPPNPNAAMSGRLRSGRLMAFMCRDLFRVQLDDGIEIVAVMPEDLFPIYNPNVRLTIVNRPSVEVEMREPPALPKIVRAWPSSFCGPGY